MTHLTALRTSVLGGIAVVAVAGCGAARLSSQGTAAPGASVPAGVTATAPAAAPGATPDTSDISKQIGGIDSQLSGIQGQLNAASAGLNTSEGDPSQ